MNRLALCCIPFVLAACVMDEEQRPQSRTTPNKNSPKSESKPKKKSLVVASISSVHLAEDCRDKSPARPSKNAAPHAMEAPADSAYPAPCSQSTLQVAFTGPRDGKPRVAIKGVRLLSAEGKPLAKLTTRSPSVWRDGAYAEWDEVLSTAGEEKAGYKLSIPSWPDVEKKVGGSSYNRMYVLEVDLSIDGVSSTVRSAEFKRFRAVALPT